VPTPLNFAADIQALELFNDKAHELMKSRFVRTFQSEDSEWTFTLQEGEVSASRFGPDNESYRAFVLTFRFFIQDRDQISIRKMAARYKRLYDNSLISRELLDNFNDARSKLQRYLDSPSSIHFLEVQHGQARSRITNREILDVFLYGNLAHVDRAKKERFDEWQDTSIVSADIENAFVMILRTHLKVISYMQGLNEKILTKLRPKDFGG
jgi:hypothetical protein